MCLPLVPQQDRKAGHCPLTPVLCSLQAVPGALNPRCPWADPAAVALEGGLGQKSREMEVLVGEAVGASCPLQGQVTSEL